MKKTIDGVEFDTEHAEQITNYDPADNITAAWLYRTKKGRYFLHTEKIQTRQRGVWRDHPMDGSAHLLPKSQERFVETIKPLSEGGAVDWYIEKLVPECLEAAIRDWPDPRKVDMT